MRSKLGLWLELTDKGGGKDDIILPDRSDFFPEELGLALIYRSADFEHYASLVAMLEV